jgi:hypothetical protein
MKSVTYNILLHSHLRYHNKNGNNIPSSKVRRELINTIIIYKLLYVRIVEFLIL